MVWPASIERLMYQGYRRMLAEDNNLSLQALSTPREVGELVDQPLRKCTVL